MAHTRRMTPMFRLYNDLLDPDKAVCANDSSARVRRMGQYFVMMDASGQQHELHIPSTDPARLWAHWQGFRAAAKQRDDAAFAGSATT